MKHCSMKSLTRMCVVLMVSAGLLAPQEVLGQGFDVQQFHPMPDQSENFFSTSSAEVAEHLRYSGVVLFNYSNDPLIRRDANGERLDSLVGHQGTTHLLLNLGLFGFMELGVDLPVVLFQLGSEIDSAGLNGDAGFGVGDLRLVPKAELFTTRSDENSDGVAIAFLLDTHLPTGDSSSLQGGDFRIGPRLALDAVIGGPRIGLNVGYLYRGEKLAENLTIRDTISLNLGVEVPVIEGVRAIGEVFGRLTPGAGEIQAEESPLEVLLGGKAQLGDIALVAAGGAGLVSGYGTPDFRGILGVGWAPVASEEPMPEPTPEPEPEPECRTATVEEDCPDVPEAICEEGVLRTYAPICEDGSCAYPVSEVRCASGTICGEEDGEPACVPAPDCEVDGDCTTPPAPICEDDVLTTFVGRCEDGGCQYDPVEEVCPEDKTCGLLRGQPGCVEATELVEVEGERIQILEVVLFETNSARIDQRSFELLSQVATVLVNNPQLRRIRIVGHTDSRGSRANNTELSQRRAESVKRFLVERGVAEERLTAVGLGPDQPLATNETEEGRALNRRVEFLIEERD